MALSVESVLEKLASGGYRSAEDLDSDLAKVDGIDSGERRTIVSKFRSSANASRNSSSTALKTLNETGNKLQQGLKTAVDIGFSTLYDQQTPRAIVGLTAMQGLFNEVIDNGLNIVSQIGTVVNTLLKSATGILDDAFKRQGDILTSLTENAGMAGEIAKSFGDTINDDVVPGAQRLGINFDQVQSATERLVGNSEKFTIYQGETLLKALEISKAYGETAKSILESVESFRNVGISLADATEDIENIGDKSISQGLSARATTKTVIDNLDKLNAFGFKNGVEGLGNMVRQAQALKFNMSEVFTVAEKLYDPESAINLAANLQVVGGAFGDLADPIKLMYDATNNVESLQTSILGAARSLATYNAEQGRFEVTGANLRRAKAMADAMGISMKELTSAAVKGQVQMQALSEIELFDLDEDQKQFVSNLASMKGGVIGLDVSKDLAKNLGISEGFLRLQDLSTNQIAKIAEAQKRLADKTPEQLIKDQYTVATQSLNALNAIAMRIGNIARSNIQENQVYDSFVKAAGGLDKIAQMSPEEIESKYGEVVSQFVDPALSKLKQLSQTTFDAASESVSGLIQKAATSGGIDLENLQETIDKKAEEVKDRGKDLLRELGITVRVDLNSTSPELAEMFVAEIDRNPKLKSDLAQKILGNKREYT